MADQYFQEHKVREMLKKAVARLAIEKPADPAKFLSDFLNPNPTTTTLDKTIDKSQSRKIVKIVAREILDSRGNPTVEVDLTTEGGVFARASVPSGASTGIHEACELRDGGDRYLGKGVLKAVAAVNDVIASAVKGMDVTEQKAIDDAMIALDGTKNKTKLGANAILGVSLAVAKAGAIVKGVPLFQHFADLADNGKIVLPMPCFNVINGGSHAGNKLAFQEYFIIPTGAKTFREAMQVGCECYHTLKKIIKKKYGGDATLIGDEGGFAPPCDARGGVELVMEAIQQAGYADICEIGMDVAASEFKVEGEDAYDLGKWYPKDEQSEDLKLTGQQLADFYGKLCEDFPIITIEDPFDQDDWSAWENMTAQMGTKCQVVGDDLTVTNIERVKRAVSDKACNALLLKVNQIGTVSESIMAVKYCQDNGWGIMTSHRSGETEDNYIADLAVGLCAGQIKTGAPCRSERTAKYNQLMRIEDELSDKAVFAGKNWRTPLKAKSYKLAPHPGSKGGVKGPLVCIILDGFGIGSEDDGDCVHLAGESQNLSSLFKSAQEAGRYCSLKAHGTHVGLPDDSDMGNSEVGHNALGCGVVVAQGAKLVNQAIADGSMFTGVNWHAVVEANIVRGKTIHLMGLLSDGGIHSNISQVESMVAALASAAVSRVRLHILTDGRDVPSMSALEFVDRIEAVLADTKLDYKLATGGGRMYVTMDRYESDWNIVKRGYDAMVHGEVRDDQGVDYKGRFTSTRQAVESVRSTFPSKSDQDYPPWVIVDEDDQPVGRVLEGDVVINFNFRGDRAIQISQAFGDTQFTAFERGDHPHVDYYGLLVYDSDLGIPALSLAPSPDIKDVLSQYLCASGVSQYAVSETHKFGHVTFFWNGNRSGYVGPPGTELYEKVESEPNDAIVGNPSMKAEEITSSLLKAIDSGKWKFLRVNYANGDMCGHTGLIPQTIAGIRLMDTCVRKVVDRVLALDGAVVITADHGNCEQMKQKNGDPKTSHTTNEVPFAIIDNNAEHYHVLENHPGDEGAPSLTNVAATLCNLLGFEQPPQYRRSLINFKNQ